MFGRRALTATMVAICLTGGTGSLGLATALGRSDYGRTAGQSPDRKATGVQSRIAPHAADRA